MSMILALAFALPGANLHMPTPLGLRSPGGIRQASEVMELARDGSLAWHGVAGCELPVAAELELRTLAAEQPPGGAILRVALASAGVQRVRADIHMATAERHASLELIESIEPGSCASVTREAVEVVAALMQRATTPPPPPASEKDDANEPPVEATRGAQAPLRAKTGFFSLLIDAGAQSGPFSVWSYGAAVGMEGYQGRAGLELRFRYASGVETFRYEGLGRLGSDGLDFERRYHQVMAAPAFCLSALAETRIRAGFCFGVELGLVSAPVSSAWVGSALPPRFWGAVTASVRMTLMSRARTGLGFGVDSWWTLKDCCVKVATFVASEQARRHSNGWAGIRIFFDLSFQLHRWHRSPQSQHSAETKARRTRTRSRLGRRRT